MLVATGLEKFLKDKGSHLTSNYLSLSSAPPSVLYHYTNAAGLTGILSSGRLWATNYRFLNDRTEVTRGLTLLANVIEERLAAVVDEIQREFLTNTLATANPFDGMLDVYVTCFCEQDDQLNQWRVYTGNSGYAIGFESQYIGLFGSDSDPARDFMLRKVIYDPEMQHDMIDKIIDIACRGLAHHSQGANLEQAMLLIAACCRHVRNTVAELLMTFKHEAFAVEQEWRLCHVIRDNEVDHLQFRQGPYGLTPYVPLDPSPDFGHHAKRLPICKITHGPSPDPSLTRYALGKALRKYNLEMVQVAGSKLPVRV